MTEQQEAFWDIIDVFYTEGLLPHVMIIGSWAEYIYQYYLESGFIANLKTQDVDFLYYNLYKPQDVNIKIINNLEKTVLFMLNKGCPELESL